MTQGPASFRSIWADRQADWGHGENTGPALGPRRAMLGPSVTGVRPSLDRAPLWPSVSLSVEWGVGLGGPEAPASEACGRMEHAWSHVYCPEHGCGSGRKGMLSPDAVPESLERGWGTDRPVPSLGGSARPSQVYVGPPRQFFFSPYGTENFHLTPYCQARKEMERGLPPGRRLGVSGKRGALWNSLVRFGHSAAPATAAATGADRGRGEREKRRGGEWKGW